VEGNAQNQGIIDWLAPLNVYLKKVLFLEVCAIVRC
jgi:hypothetical protein